jgi:lipopolysaccharide export system permease protein
MKTIQRSILRELLLAFLLGVLALNFVLMTEKVLRLTRLLSTVGASLEDMTRIILYLQPQITVLTIPMSLLMAVLLVYGRMNADNEITVMRASGMSFRAISMPVFLFGAGCFLAGVATSFYVFPASAERLRAVVSRVIAERAPYAIEEGIFNTSFRDIVVFVKEKPSVGRMNGIFIYDERKKEQPTVVYAREGVISGSDGYSISFELRDGHVHMVRDGASTELSFRRYVLSLPTALETPPRKYHELTPIELLREAGTGGANRTKILLEFHRRLSLPAVCLLLVFFGPPLALKAGKAGRLGGLTIGLSVFALYHGALVYSENLVRSGKLPHYVGAWAPAVVLGAVALWMFRKADSR